MCNKFHTAIIFFCLTICVNKTQAQSNTESIAVGGNIEKKGNCLLRKQIQRIHTERTQETKKL